MSTCWQMFKWCQNVFSLALILDLHQRHISTRDSIPRRPVSRKGSHSYRHIDPIKQTMDSTGDAGALIEVSSDKTAVCLLIQDRGKLVSRHKNRQPSFSVSNRNSMAHKFRRLENKCWSDFVCTEEMFVNLNSTAFNWISVCPDKIVH